MILAHYELNNPIIFQEGIVNVLVVENPIQMSKFIIELISQSNGVDGGFELSAKNESLPISNKVTLVTDVFSIDLNERDFLNKLYMKMKMDALSEDMFLDTNAILAEIERHFEKIMLRQNPQLESSVPDLQSLFKSLNIRHAVPETTLEKICDYIDLCSEYRKTVLFIFLNIKSFLDETEIQNLYLHSSYRKYNLLLIENKQYSHIKGEIIRIIDKDLCEFQISDDNDIFWDAV